jgi:hypothetical protein
MQKLVKYSPMNVHTLRLFVALLFLSAASPGFAQTSGGIPPAIWTQIEALTDGAKKTLNIAYGPADAQKLDVYEPATPVTKAPVLIANGKLHGLLCHRDNQCPLMYRFLMHDHISLLNFIRAL